jgi:DNA transformation protein
MSEQQDFATHIADLPGPFGYCEARGMFGVYGIFHQGLMFGLIAEGSRTFSYFKEDRGYQLSYYLAVDDFPEDDAACLRRTGLIFEAVLRNPARRKQKKS